MKFLVTFKDEELKMKAPQNMVILLKQAKSSYFKVVVKEVAKVMRVDQGNCASYKADQGNQVVVPTQR